jgi:hypothetical protein
MENILSAGAVLPGRQRINYNITKVLKVWAFFAHFRKKSVPIYQIQECFLYSMYPTASQL